MIRITKQTDYGIVLLTHLSAQPERQYNAPDLAAEAQLPLPMVSKILKHLAREGLLLSHRGVKGGYSLARPPREISMAEIISALEGPIAITECIDEMGNCFHEPICQVRSNWQRINDAVRGALAGITLAEMALPFTSHGEAKLVTLGGHRDLLSRASSQAATQGGGQAAGQAAGQAPASASQPH
jgi:FeS assembly SUF system regulator